MELTAPPNRAMSLITDERSTEYFWSVGIRTVSTRGFNDRFIAASSNS